MKLLGCPSVGELNGTYVTVPREWVPQRIDGCPEVRLLVPPRSSPTVDDRAPPAGGGARLLLFVLGCGLSAAATGRFTLRLIVDGMLSFAFVPAITIALLAVIGRPSPSRLPFARAIDVFFAGYAGWLRLARDRRCGDTAAVPPRDLGPWLIPLELSLLASRRCGRARRFPFLS